MADAKKVLRELLGITRELSVCEHMEKPLGQIVRGVQSAFDCNTVAVILTQPDTEELRIKSAVGISSTFAKTFARSRGVETVGRVLWEQETVVVGDAHAEPEVARDLRLENDFRSAMCVVISLCEQSVGMLYCDSEQPNKFSLEDVDCLRLFASIAAVAIEKDELYRLKHELTVRDETTGMLTFRAFFSRLSDELVKARVLGQSMSLVLMDLDNFKYVRDTFGQEAAKKLVAEVARLVRGSTKRIDLVGAYGPDEMIICLLNANLEKALKVAERVRARIASTVLGDGKISTTVSVGVADSEGGKEATAMLHDARSNLFRAQRDGRNRVCGGPAPEEA